MLLSPATDSDFNNCSESEISWSFLEYASFVVDQNEGGALETHQSRSPCIELQSFVHC